MNIIYEHQILEFLSFYYKKGRLELNYETMMQE